MEEKIVDFLIVGQGLAGTLLANRLLSEGKTVQIVADTEGGASNIAAGVINPVTGRRIVKSWRYEEFYLAAKTVYQDLEKEYHIKVWHDFNILRTLKLVVVFSVKICVPACIFRRWLCLPKCLREWVYRFGFGKLNPLF